MHLSGFRRTRQYVAVFFPTDFSSTMPSADFPLAIAGVATDPLQGAVFFVSPKTGLVLRSRRPFHAEALISRLPLFRHRSCRTVGSPGVLPCCFPCVTVRSTKRDISITGGLILVLQSRPCSLAYTCRRAVS